MHKRKQGAPHKGWKAAAQKTKEVPMPSKDALIGEIVCKDGDIERLKSRIDILTTENERLRRELSQWQAPEATGPCVDPFQHQRS